jgi:hypothetical protein
MMRAFLRDMNPARWPRRWHWIFIPGWLGIAAFAVWRYLGDRNATWLFNAGCAVVNSIIHGLWYYGRRRS